MDKNLKILFAGGGTGGHLFPIIAISRELKNLYQKDNLVLQYIGPKDKLSEELLRQENFKIHFIASGKLRRYFSLLNITDILFKIPFSFLQSFFILLFIRPKLVFSKGGTGSLPATFCARVLGIPVFIHESDIEPGLSNKISAKWAKKIFTSFENTANLDSSKMILVGNPIRKELLDGNAEGAREMLGITFDKPVILFYGGSQGAKMLNDFVLDILEMALRKYEIIHICGKNNYKQIKKETDLFLNENSKKYYHLFDSLNEDQLKNAYSAADIIISRAGSASIFEIAALAKPSILIPLPSAAGDHQSKNAYAYAKNGATDVLEQENMIPNFFLGRIDSILSNPQEMQQAAREFSKPMAAQNIAKEILQYLNIG